MASQRSISFRDLPCLLSLALCLIDRKIKAPSSQKFRVWFW